MLCCVYTIPCGPEHTWTLYKQCDFIKKLSDTTGKDSYLLLYCQHLPTTLQYSDKHQDGIDAVTFN